MEESNPAIYEQLIEKYGYNLDNPDIPVAFFQTADPAVWATYVLLPLYNYYKEFYAANPTHPNATIESFVDTATTSGEYWLNPIGQLKEESYVTIYFSNSNSSDITAACFLLRN